LFAWGHGVRDGLLSFQYGSDLGLQPQAYGYYCVLVIAFFVNPVLSYIVVPAIAVYDVY
jgi:hypothetical protein